MCSSWQTAPRRMSVPGARSIQSAAKEISVGAHPPYGLRSALLGSAAYAKSPLSVSLGQEEAETGTGRLINITIYAPVEDE